MGGLILHIQAWAKDGHLTDARRHDMTRVSRYASEMMIEGRDRFASLRSCDDRPLDLLADIKTLAETYSALHGTTVSVHQEGTPRQLRADVARDVLDITREGVRNAFIHAGASAIDVVVSYEDQAFSVRVVDDGKGMPPGVLGAGRRPGHWGIAGMHERAKNIGAVLEIIPVREGGTALGLKVRARRAYGTMWTRLLGHLNAAPQGLRRWRWRARARAHPFPPKDPTPR